MFPLRRYALCAYSLLATVFIYVGLAPAQNFERYKPQTLPQPNVRPTIPFDGPAPATGSEKKLVDSLDAVIVLDDEGKVDATDDHKDSVGIEYDFADGNSLVFGQDFQFIIESYLGRPITLRRLNEMSRDIILLYREYGQPVVDVVIPEQRVTAGSVQIVVVETRIGQVRVEGACHFNPCMLANQIYCTYPGSRVYEHTIASDLSWLNRNPFRRVGVDLRPGDFTGTTDVIFQVHDVLPLRGYVGYEDTGVRSLALERFYAGFICGNAFRRDGTLSYQYTADTSFTQLEAHSASYTQPIDRWFAFNAYGSWSGVRPDVPGFTQQGESWQLGAGFTCWLTRNQCQETSVSLGVDFKTTNNNLEFAGQNVFNSEADLLQLKLGLNHIRRYGCGEYMTLSNDIYVGPGGGFSSKHSAAAFNTIRAGTSPDYVYDRLRFEQACNVGSHLQFISRFVGQIASERLLFSETLGLGGYDTVRGYDQRTLNADGGWITNLELGLQPLPICNPCDSNMLRVFGFCDLGQSFILDPLPGEREEEFIISAGVGVRANLGDYCNVRFDYGHTFNTVPGQVARDRVHLGVVYLMGPRP